jgi:Kef-type K+ transport system membrane component KefB
VLISRGREFHDPFLTTRIAITEFISDFSIVLDVLFVPLFFTYIGVAYKPGAVDPLLFLVLLTAATAGKLFGTGPIAYLETRNRRKSLAIGLAMGGRGSLETALLKLGLDTGIISETLFTTALTVAITTTILAPILYTIAYGRR